MPHINELRDKAERLYARQQEILDREHTDDDPALTEEERSEFDRIETELDPILGDIKRMEVAEAARADRPKPGELRPAAVASDDAATRAAYQSELFEKYLRKGKDGLSYEENRSLETRAIGDSPLTVTTTAGGHTIPQGFQAELIVALKAYGGVRTVARELNTPAGNDIPWPTMDDTSNTGELLAINTAAADGPVAFGQKTLKAYKYSSKAVLVPIELVQDSAFDIGAEIRAAFAIRLGRITNTHFTTGDNSGKPQGVAPGAYSAVTAEAATGVSYNDLVNLEHSVDLAYRQQGNCVFMLADTTVKSLKKLKTADGEPIWRRFGSEGSLSGRAPEDICGYPFVTNVEIPAATTGLVSVLFGDFSHYVVRNVMDISLLTLHERWAEYGQVGYLAFMRSDGRYVVGETNNGPVRSLTQA